MNLKEHSKIKLVFFALLVSTILMSFQTQHANALIPSIVSISYGTSGTHTILNITVNHTPPPPLGSAHYVSIVEVDVNGTIQDLTQTTPQSTETFTVQYDIGEVSAPLAVRARAHCIVHGWGDWSTTTTVPEYSPFSLALVLMLGTSIILIMKLLHGSPRKKRALNSALF
jgi:hypothetical protein